MRYPHISLIATLIAFHFLHSELTAAPSGGPYGPIQSNYAPPADAKRIYYVAPDGSASSNGSSAEKPTTLESAISKAETNDAIILRGGVYRSGSLRLSQGITLQPFQDEQPILKGTRVATKWKQQEEGRWQTYWPTLFPAQAADWWRKDRNVDRTPLHRFNNDMLFVDGQRLLSVGSLEDLSPDTYYIDYEKAMVVIAQDPSDKQIEITAHNSALVRTMRRAHGKDNDGIGPTIRGIAFTQYARLALEIEGVEPGKYMSPENFGKEIVGATLEHLTISHCSRVAGYFRGDNLTIRHCLIADCGTEGIYVINSANLLLERNIVTRTNSFERFTGYYASSVKIFNQSYNAVCRDNLIIDNPHASGIWYDVGNVDGLVVDNWFQNNGDGFFFEISKGATAGGNVFVNCTPGSRVLNSSDVKLYQNTYYNSQASFVRTTRSHTAGDHFGWHTSAGPDVDERHSHVFVNNLLVASESFEEPLLFFYEPPELADRLKEPQVSQMDGNVYAHPYAAEDYAFALVNPSRDSEPELSAHLPSHLAKRYPGSSDNDQLLPQLRSPIFQSPELSNFNLLDGFPGTEVGIPLPEEISEQLDPSHSGSPFPGAYPPQ